MSNLSAKIRLDKWLWAARFYKTRTIAKEAIEKGKVRINNMKCKPGREPKIGDTITLRIGIYEKTVTIFALSDKRGKAEIAQQLYIETQESIALREKAAIERKTVSAYSPKPDKRPNKKERRKLINIKAQ